MTQEDARLPLTSSVEPEWTMGAEEFYRDVMRTLQEADIRYAVGGTFAIHKHTGIWRPTKDLDLLLAPNAVPAALLILESAGFTTSIKDRVWLAKVHRGEHFVDLITGLGNAALIVDDEWIERSVPDAILGIPCRVLRAEELIATKVFIARRERFDGSDVVHLIRSCSQELDWQRLFQLLTGHWELLFWSLILFAYIYPARTDLVPVSVWNRLTSHFEQSVLHPRKDEPFRGSLIDPNMFAIDVNERGERNLYRENCENHPCLLRMRSERD